MQQLLRNFMMTLQKMADDLGIEVSEPRSKKVSRHLDENRENQHVMVSNEDFMKFWML